MSGTSLETLRKQCFYAIASKCTFCFSELEYLGHMVGRDRIKVNPRTVSSDGLASAFAKLQNGLSRQGMKVLIVDLYDQL